MKKWLLKIISFLVLWLVATYVLDFSASQGIWVAAMTMALLAVSNVVDNLTKRNWVDFTPFYIHVIPKWFPLFRELGLVKNGDDPKWRKFRQSDLASQGLKVTILKPDQFFYENRGQFMSSLKVGQTIWELDGKDAMPPTVYIIQSLNGYEVGLEVPPSFKEIMTDKIENEKKEIAISIPYGEFFPYFGKEISNSDKSEIEEILLKQKIERDEDAIGDSPNHLEHEFFDIYYKLI